MAILENLEALRAGLPGAETAAYMDLRSGTVLGKSAAVEQPQERFDALCALAIDVLGGPTGETDEAVYMKATEATVVCRSAGASTEALCLVCAPDADVAAVLGGARRALEEAG